ncbi:MAG: hypothetical protein QNK03_15615 [Myxococcota bacterium]|nr:hypothetical protein [Myxococcota bacterium]
MTDVSAADPVSTAKASLVPLLHALDAELANDGQAEPRAFFGRILQMVEAATEPEDLAGPFMELSTSAFRGFQFGITSMILVDQVLEAAQTLAFTLSADADTAH